MGFLDRITGPGGRDPDLLDGNLNRPLPWASRPAPAQPQDEAPSKPRRAPTNPKDMQPDEIRFGFVVAGILALVAVLNMAITTGKGAPKNPPYLLSGIGLAVVAVMVGLLLARRRMLSPFAAVVAAFCVTYGKTPNSLVVGHFVAIIAPVVWAFWITQRTNKAMRAQRIEAAQAKRDARRQARHPGNQPGGRRGKKEPEPTGPPANRRYTPPKPRNRQPAAAQSKEQEAGRSRFRRAKARPDAG